MKVERLGMLSAVLASSCCTIPLALVLLGLSGAGVGSFFGEHHWWFQGAAALLLGAAWWFFVREKRRLRGLNAEVKNERFTRWVLTVASGVLVLFVGMSVRNAVVAGVLAAHPQGDSTSVAGQAAFRGNLASVTLPVKGMTCITCEIHVRSVLKKVDGVKEAEVSAATQSATITYDPGKVTPDELARVISRETPYQASAPTSSTSR